MNTKKILLVDDSNTVLMMHRMLLHGQPYELFFARDGREAVEKALAQKPDLIFMDVMMPRLDGLGATAAIMAEAPARVLIVSSLTETQMDLSFRAIEAGALELISKPKTSGLDDLRKWGRRVAESIRLMAEVPVITRRRLATLPDQMPRTRVAPVDIFGIVASTGGPPALALLLGALPAKLPVPILIAQHITEGFTGGLVRWLSAVCPLKVAIAQDGKVAMPGEVYLAPDGHHLELDGEGVMRCVRHTTGHCPSGNRLLSSLARAYGARAGGVVLTGMGDDGAQGLLDIRNAGGQTFAQDAASSVVFGMPQAAYQMKATQMLLPLEAMAPMIRELAEHR